jgi:hypothetical protein
MSSAQIVIKQLIIKRGLGSQNFDHKHLLRLIKIFARESDV